MFYCDLLKFRTLLEDGIVIEEIEALYPFDEDHPLPVYAIRNNDEINWEE